MPQASAARAPTPTRPRPDLETSSDPDSHSDSRSHSPAHSAAANEEGRAGAEPCGRYIASYASPTIKRLADLTNEEKELLVGPKGARSVLEERFDECKWAKQLIPGFLGIGRFTQGEPP